jgi:hypothetical protein
MRSWEFKKTDDPTGLILHSVEGANFRGLRIGTTATPVSYGGNEVHSIVARRALQKVWKLDYTSQTDLDRDCLKVIEAVGKLSHWASQMEAGAGASCPITYNITYQIANMSFVRLVHFNEETGAETSSEDVS